MPTPPLTLTMTPLERRASVVLAGLFACRMLGLFLLLPVFAVAAHSLRGGENPARVGLALGMYGLTQACLQIPFGLASDRWGRRPVVLAGLLLFVAGSIVCALSPDVLWVTVGRGIQGAGAISAAVTAWLADLTRPEVRTRAMALVGVSIGLSFATSLVVAPLLVGWGGLAGLFWTIACLGAASMAVAGWVAPAGVVANAVTNAASHAAQGPVASAGKPPGSSPGMWYLQTPQRAWLRAVLGNAELLRLNAGVFVLHAVQMALFVVMPGLLARLGGWQAGELWRVYLPVVLASFVLMVPVLLWMEKHRLQKRVLQAAVLGLALVCLSLVPLERYDAFWGLAAALTGFFLAFNLLEALQPALVSQAAPPDLKGLALGCYNTAQSLGLFAGGAAGGALAARAGASAVFVTAALLAALWWGLLQTRSRERS